MITCPRCHRPATKPDGYDACGRQRSQCRPCPRDCTADSTSAFSGYRWPPAVILLAVQWYASRLRCVRGLRTVHTGQRFLESFAAFHALRRGTIKIRELVPDYRPRWASVHETPRAVVTAMEVLGTQLKKAA